MSNRETPTTERRRVECGYQSPHDRDGCCRCFHSQVIAYEATQLRCVKNTLRVHKLAICPQFTRTRPPPLIPAEDAKQSTAGA